MDYINEASWHLLKSPKELASWNFPLSKMLDNYFNLLPEACKIQYGETALVIQNSVNAYVRRVEELYDETKSLRIKMINSDFTDSKLLSSHNEINSRKFITDIDNFAMYKFDEEMGKNNNLKIHAEKAMKFLHHCFPQYKNIEAKLIIKLFDVTGETMGKKYDFRCNQKITKCGSLIEEFVPKDFAIVEKLKFVLHSTPFIYAKSVSVSIDSSENFNYFTSSDNDLKEYTTEAMIEDSSLDTIQSKVAYSDLKTSTRNSNIYSFHSNKSANIESHLSSSEFVDNIKWQPNSTDAVFYKSRSQEDVSQNEIQLKKKKNNNIDSFIINTLYQENQSNTRNIEHRSIIKKNNFKENESLLSDSLMEEIVCSTTNSKKTNNSNNSVQFFAQLRRSKRLYSMHNPEYEFERNTDKSLKPILFQDGIPDKMNKSRKDFQLPCHVNLLKNNLRKIKRTKKIKNIKKLRSLVSSSFGLVPESENPENTDCVDMQILKKETVNDLPQVCIKILLNNQKYSDSSTILHSSAENINLPQSVLKNQYSLENQVSPVLRMQSNICHSLNNHVSTLNRHNKCRSTIKHKIKELYKDLEWQNAIDHKVAKWHKEIKSRLIAAEMKTPFYISEYESRILRRLKSSNRKLQFDDIIRQEPTCEVARYFSATLKLASTHNLDINISKNFEKSIELILLD